VSARTAERQATPDRAAAPPVRRKVNPGRVATPAPTDVMRQSGSPLDAGLRRTMEDRFGHDFGDVRVHADEHAAASANDLDAAAYSTGRHIVFGAGRFAPDTLLGQHLLAHELAHVVQRENAASDRPIDGARSTDAPTLEADARQAATAVVGGGRADVQQSATETSLMRQESAGNTAPGTTPTPAPSRPAHEEHANIGRAHHRVDAELDRPIGLLTVKMKVKFVPRNTPQPWPSTSRFEQFKTGFVRAVAARWSFKHFLVPQSECPGEPPRVSVRVQVLPVTSGEHRTVTVGYATEFQRSNVSELDVLDTELRSDRPQVPVEHEFGHMLGLPHIHCDRDDDECYGITREEKADIMGMGSFVSPRDYEPFAELMPSFTSTSCPYRVQQASFIPTSRAPDIGAGIGGFLGALGGGAAGLAIGAAVGGPIGAAIGGLIGLIGGGIGGFFAGRALATPEVPS